MCAWRLLFRLVEVGVEPADEDVLDVQGLGKACLAACAVYIYIYVCVYRCMGGCMRRWKYLSDLG